MIRLESIHIHEFRGIRDLTLDFNGENFAACGPNGTGKSGIVDAIEFALTGNISRLTGAGTGGLSVKDHGPHVDSRNKPDQAYVTLSVSIPSLRGKKATIRRTIKAANAPAITPNDADVKAAFDDVKIHPEFVLSRRELIRYVLSEPGQRSKEVQALLRLDEIEKLRTVLQKIANACERDVPALERVEKEAVGQLLSALNITELTKTVVLAAVNPQRELLGLPALTALEATTSLKDGLAATAGEAAPARVPKAQAFADLTALKEALEQIRAPSFSESCTQAAAEAIALAAEDGVEDGVSREALLQSALTLFDEKACPVCDTPFDSEHFRQHVLEKLKSLEAITVRRKMLEQQVQPIMDIIHAVGTSLAAMIEYGPRLKPAPDPTALKDFKAVLVGRYQQLKKLLPLSETGAVLLASPEVPDLSVTLEVLVMGIAAIPEPTKQDAARDFLVVGQERLEKYRDAKQKSAMAKQRAARAKQVFELYGRIVTTELENVYKAVETKFSAYYRMVNHQDESAFTAKLMPSIGKLGFDVDFYGRGHFPPGAYHSEGHQDGMGLCLYLALMRHLLGNNFTFAVLDDVLMSVDAGHRREVCGLLKRHFPQTQFIFTTHDEIWLKHMKSEGLVKGRNFAHFRTWNVDVGPKEWDNLDIWAEVDKLLESNDVRGAAALLRHYLEHFFKEACDRLRASVEFRGDAQFTLGDLLPNATSELGKLYGKAKSAANSWNQKEVIETISARDAAFSVVKKKVDSDKWQLNATVHFNEWDNLQKADFVPVVAAFKEFTEAFMCTACHEMYYVVPAHEPKKQTLRCGCAATNLNLLGRT
jgi:recombinational DNA repair ATPase RecF